MMDDKNGNNSIKDDENMIIDDDELEKNEDAMKIDESEGKKENSHEKTFDNWVQSCLDPSASLDIKDELHSTSFHYFTSLDLENPVTTEGTAAKITAGGMMALLLSKLGPPLSKPKSIYKIKSLAILHGALEGLSQNEQHPELPYKVVELVGNFLLNYIGPLDIEDDEEDVRDLGIKCIHALLSIPAATTDEKTNGKEEWALLRLHLGRTAVQHRCALEEYEEEVAGGLSYLTRLRRSYCFDTLHATIMAIQQMNLGSAKITLAFQKSTNEKMKEFCTHAISCLHNETDPRCLIQMLKLLHSLQNTFSPLLIGDDGNSDDDDIMFPHTELFDAIAPYYPIQFTPPPNDVHGITKESLQHSLLTCFSYPENEMRQLSIRLFLDRISPPAKQKKGYYDDDDEEEEESTVMDKLEALDDLAYLFGMEFKQNEAEQKTENDRPLHLSLLTPELLRELSDGLVRTHEEAIQFLSSPPSSRGKEKEEERFHRTLAHRIRSFSSTLSLQLEKFHPLSQPSKASDDENPYQLWNAFVLHSIQSLSISISSSPQTLHGRASTVFLASLSAGGGGERTARSVLSLCIPSLLGLLQENQIEGDEEKIVAACFALGAFFSSVGAATERKAKKEGQQNYVFMHPHPLKDYGMEAITLLASFLGVDKTKDSSSIAEISPGDVQSESKEKAEEDGNASYSLQIAATRALESVLLSTPSSILFYDKDEENSLVMRSMVCNFLSHLTKAIIVGEPNEEKEEEKMEKEWKKACAKTIGSLMGRSLSKGVEEKEDKDMIHEGKGSIGNTNTCVMDDDKEIIRYVHSQILLPTLKSSSTANRTKDIIMAQRRYDRMALAYACANGNKNVSKTIVASIVEELVKSLQTDNGVNIQHNPAMAPAMTLSHLFQSGGHHTIEAFHDLKNNDSTNTTPMDIIKALSNPPGKKKKKNEDGSSARDGGGGRIVLGMSRLMLPETKEQNRAEVQELVKQSYAILPHIIPAYKRATPSSEIDSVVQFVSQVIPPLTEWDELKLCTALPVLATILNRVESANAVASKIASNEGINFAAPFPISSATKELLKEMVTCLAEYAISTDHDAEARSSAASTVFSILLHHQVDDDNDESIGHSLLRNVISPTIAQYANMITQILLEVEKEDEQSTKSRTFDERITVNKKRELQAFFDTFESTMDLMALVGSAAACRGGKSSQMSDLVIRFLIKLTCTGSAMCPETNEQIVINNTSPIFDSVLEALSIIAGSSFGAILSVENGGPFWRQRVSHVSLPEILRAFDASSGGSKDAVTTTFINFPLGPLLAGSHIVCCVPITVLGDKKVNELAGIIVRGLISCASRISSAAMSKESFVSTYFYRALNLVLVSVLKLVVAAPSVMSRYTSSMIPYLLLTCESLKNEGDTSRHTMALQCLINIPSLPNSKKVCIAYRMPVLSYVGEALDSCSLEVRQAAVHVRNSWCTIE